MQLPALAFSSSLPFSRNADVKHQTQKLMDMAAEAAGLCAKDTSSTFGPQALGGEGQRYPSCPRASTSTRKLFRHDEVHLALAFADQEEPAKAQIRRTDRARHIGPSGPDCGPTLAQKPPGLTLRSHDAGLDE